MFTIGTATKLETQSFMPPQAPPPPPIPHTIVKPISYQFQVVEYMKDDKVVKVELQVQQTIHDENGNVIRSSGFQAVPRIQLPLIDHK